MKAKKTVKFPSEIEEAIQRMAHASFRTFEEEVEALRRQGMSVPTGNAANDEVRLTAELAFLHEAEVEESDEDPVRQPRRTSFIERLFRGGSVAGDNGR